MKTLLLLTAVCMLSACHTVEPGHVGVVTSWGATEKDTRGEGFGWVGIGTDVYDLSVQVQAVDFEKDNHITVLSRDRLRMGMDLAVQYRLNAADAPKVFQSFYNRSEEQETYSDRLVKPAVKEAIRDVVSHFEALEATQKRDQLSPKILEATRARIRALLVDADLPKDTIQVVGVQVTHIELPNKLRESIEAIQTAQNQAMQRQEEITVAKQEAERLRIEAEGKAAVAQIKAEQDAKVRLITAKSNAEANREVARSLTPQLLDLQRIEANKAILSSGSTSTIVLGGGGNTNTILDLGTLTKARK